MNELVKIEIHKNTDTFDKDKYRQDQLSKITNLSDYEDFVIENIIETDVYGFSDFELEDLTDIVKDLISDGLEINVDNIVELIEEHNSCIIWAAIQSFKENIGLDHWLEIMKDKYGVTQKSLNCETKDDLVEEIEDMITQETYALTYQGMHSSYFPKIVNFCVKQNIELHIDDDYEIYDVLFFAEIVDKRFHLSHLLMPNIKKAVVSPALSGVIDNRAFIMGDTLFVPNILMTERGLAI